MRIFVASTMTDLLAFRHVAATQIQRLGHEVVDVGQLSNLTPAQIADACRAKVRICDAGLVIVGKQRGTGPDDALRNRFTAQSFTEIEAREAILCHLPLFTYVVDDEALAGGAVEKTYPEYRRRLEWVDDFQRWLWRETRFRWGIRSKQHLEMQVHMDLVGFVTGDLRPSMPLPAKLFRDGPPSLWPMDSTRIDPRASDFQPAAVPAQTVWRTAYLDALSAHGLGRPHEALDHINSALVQGGSESVDVLHSHGVILFSLGRKEEAIEAWKRALSIDPHHVEAQFGIGSTLSDLGRYEEAIKVLDSLVSEHESYYKAWNSLGYAHRLLRQTDHARACYMRALQFKPDSEVARDGLLFLQTPPPVT